jgi:predicted nucleic acid-binding protein
LDNKKARLIAENFRIKCVEIVRIISIAKELNWIDALKPLFGKLIEQNRYFSHNLLNIISKKFKEHNLNT